MVVARFLLDTNVLSEATKDTPDPNVIAWLDRYSTECVIPAPVIMEIQYGISRLPSGRRRLLIEESVRAVLASFPSDILCYGHDEAIAQAEIRRSQELNGLVTSAEDQQIAAIARTHGLIVVTRNALDYEHAGVQVINPWEEISV